MMLLTMIFLHIIDDFVLQPLGWLANGKQRSWWKENAPEPKYQYDYLCALFMHSFSWTFMIMIPVAWFQAAPLDPLFYWVFAGNIAVHGTVDHIKANLRKINLIQDQLIHLVQIIITYLVLQSQITLLYPD
ncbi:MAG: hypothetical protein AAGU75_12855 [Bacillota bacterium]